MWWTFIEGLVINVFRTGSGEKCPDPFSKNWMIPRGSYTPDKVRKKRLVCFHIIFGRRRVRQYGYVFILNWVVRFALVQSSDRWSDLKNLIFCWKQFCTLRRAAAQLLVLGDGVVLSWKFFSWSLKNWTEFYYFSRHHRGQIFLNGHQHISWVTSQKNSSLNLQSSMESFFSHSCLFLSFPPLGDKVDSIVLKIFH